MSEATDRRKEISDEIQKLQRELKEIERQEREEIQKNIKETMVGKYYKNSSGIYKVIGVPKIEHAMVYQYFEPTKIPAICIYFKEDIFDVFEPDGTLPCMTLIGDPMKEATEEEFMEAFDNYTKKLFSYIDETTSCMVGRNPFGNSILK